MLIVKKGDSVHTLPITFWKKNLRFEDDEFVEALVWFRPGKPLGSSINIAKWDAVCVINDKFKPGNLAWIKAPQSVEDSISNPFLEHSIHVQAR